VIKKIAVSVVMTVFATACASTNKTTEPASTPAPTKAAAPVKPSQSTTPKAVAKPETKATAAVECIQGKDTRTLHVVSQSPAGCELKYSKFGNTDTAATSSTGLQHCETVRDKIKGNLETAGFKCN